MGEEEQKTKQPDSKETKGDVTKVVAKMKSKPEIIERGTVHTVKKT